MAQGKDTPQAEKPKRQQIPDGKKRLAVLVDEAVYNKILIGAVQQGHGRNFGPFAQDIFEAGLKAKGI